MRRFTDLIVWLLLVTGLVLAGYTPPASATNPLNPGNSGVAVPEDNSYPGAGSLIADTGPLAFTSYDFQGTLETKVYNVGGTLDFFYQVIQTGAGTSGGNHSIDRVTVGPFDSFSTSVGYNDLIAIDTVAPVTADRDSTGAVVGFNFTTGDLKNDATYWFYVVTDATYYGPGIASVINLGIASVESYAPAVPLPPTVLLLGSGLIGLAGLGWRRRKAGI